MLLWIMEYGGQEGAGDMAGATAGARCELGAAGPGRRQQRWGAGYLTQIHAGGWVNRAGDDGFDVGGGKRGESRMTLKFPAVLTCGRGVIWWHREGWGG